MNTALPEELVIASFEVVALQDSADSPLDQLLPPVSASRLITRLHIHQAPKDEL